MEPRLWLTLAALEGFMGVAGGAFGAHGAADARAKALLETGGHYQLMHALAVFACFAALKLLGARLAGAGQLIVQDALPFVQRGEVRQDSCAPAAGMDARPDLAVQVMNVSAHSGYLEARPRLARL